MSSEENKLENFSANRKKDQFGYIAVGRKKLAKNDPLKTEIKLQWIVERKITGQTSSKRLLWLHWRIER